jgi:hypothetical protein
VKRVIEFIVLLLITFLYPIVAIAQEVAETAVEVVPDISGFWAAISAQNWPLAVGIGLAVVVWAARKWIVKKLPKKALPWVTLALAICGTTGTRIVQFNSEGRPWWQGMIQGILEGSLMGFAAMGMWDVKQTVVKKE